MPTPSFQQSDVVQPVLSYAPLLLPAPGRGSDLEIRVTAAASGGPLPVIVFSHGNGQSHYAYGPLSNYWAAQGFIVLQPTHLDSRRLSLARDDPRQSRLWQHREDDLVCIIDQLAEIEDALPLLSGRIDHRRIAVAGHSWGGQTASTLLGATHPDPDTGEVVRRKDDRVKAGVLLATPGRGGSALSPAAAQRFPFLHPDFSEMTVPSLIVMGDADGGGLSVMGPDWWRDAYDLSPGPKALFTVYQGGHSLGGITGYEAREVTDESADRLSAVLRLSTAFLRSTLYQEDAFWNEAVAELDGDQTPQGRTEQK